MDKIKIGVNFLLTEEDHTTIAVIRCRLNRPVTDVITEAIRDHLDNCDLVISYLDIIETNSGFNYKLQTMVSEDDEPSYGATFNLEQIETY